METRKCCHSPANTVSLYYVLYSTIVAKYTEGHIVCRCR